MTVVMLSILLSQVRILLSKNRVHYKILDYQNFKVFPIVAQYKITYIQFSKLYLMQNRVNST